MFPDARLHWFHKSGHFPHGDEPQAAARLILESLPRAEFAGNPREATFENRGAKLSAIDDRPRVAALIPVSI